MIPDPDGLASLINTIDGLSGEVSDLRSEVRVENDTRDSETRTTRMFAKIAAVIGVIGLLVGALGVYEGKVARDAAADAQKALNQVVATRNEGRKTTCDSDNKFITNHNQLVDNVEKGANLADKPDPNRSPEQQAELDKFVMDYVASIEKSRVATRDCSPEGIAAFYGE